MRRTRKSRRKDEDDEEDDLQNDHQNNKFSEVLEDEEKDEDDEEDESLIRVQEGEKMKRVNEKFVAAFAEIYADIPASDPALRFDEERGRGG